MLLHKKLFSGEVPVHHIENGSSLEPEILHVNRPFMSPDLKSRAKLLGLNDEIQQLMHDCWQSEAKKRPSMRDVFGLLSEHMESVPDRLRESDFGCSTVMTRCDIDCRHPTLGADYLECVN